MKTYYAEGKKDVINEMVHYCQKKINEIKEHPPTDREEVRQKRNGVLSAYTDVIKRLDVKLKRILANE
jgi:hypothetical protein